MNHPIKILAGIIFLLSAGCVSVNLSNNKSKKAEGLSYMAPTGSFHPLKAENADQAWQSEKTGNTIAFLSECQMQSDIDLKTIESDSLTALTQIKILSSFSGQFNNRESIDTLAEGQVDGVPVRLRLTVFKKNGCNYTLSYVGRKNFLDKEESEFIRFKESFKAP